MKKVIVFAGTTEGRLLCEFFEDMKIFSIIHVATEYGEQVLDYLAGQSETLSVVTGKLNEQQMVENFKQEHPDLVIDATHVFAEEATVNIRNACEKTKIPYFRLVREIKPVEDLITVSSVEEAVSYINQNIGRVFVSTENNDIELFTKVNDFAERVYIRVLLSPEMIQKCLDMGYDQKHIIAMQGSFSEEMNYAVLREYDTTFLVTKDSDDSEGFSEKIKGAKRAGVSIIVITRPKEESGYTLEEIREMFV